MPRPKNTFEQTVAAFWLRVDCRSPNECWPWLGWIQRQPKSNGGGYGKFSVSKYKTVLPHRFAWEIANGPIPKGMLVCHHCDNRRCCNPAHLFIGTHKDNTQDAVRKGRLPTGEEHALCKLSKSQIDDIKERYVPRRGVSKLASEFGINPGYVWAIANGKARIAG